jgi:hypothetical protein
LEKAVGEASGGRADVEADFSGDVDAEMIERAFELQAPTTDKARGCFEVEDGIIGKEQARFGGGVPVHTDLTGDDEPLGLLP